MKMMRKLLAVLCVLALMASLPVLAFAAGGPGPEDIVATGDDKKIVMPDADSYLSEYKDMYISAAKYLSLSGYSEPREGIQRPRAVVFHGTRVTVLAEQDGFYCVRYRTADLATVCAWIPARFLSETYPGTVQTIGSDKGGSIAQGDHSVSWSWGRFPGTGGRYLLLAEPCENCTGFTLDYQVISKEKKAEYADGFGKRNVYIHNGEQWVKVGSFDYKALGAVNVTVNLDQPTTVVAVRTIAECKKPDSFLAREDVLDVRA